MKRKICTETAPEAQGPYSQAVEMNGLFFVSGQVPLNPRTGQIVSGGIAEQTTQVLDNLSAVLVAGGASLDTVVKTTIYLVDLNDFQVVNRIYGTYFNKGVVPARATVQVAALPLDALIEIDAIAAG